MANAFKSETDTAIGASAATVFTCASNTQTTVIGLSCANIVTSQIAVSVKLVGSGRTSGATDNVHLIKNAPIPVGGTLVIVGGDQKLVMEPGDTITVQSDTASSVDVVLSHLDIT